MSWNKIEDKNCLSACDDDVINQVQMSGRDFEKKKQKLERFLRTADMRTCVEYNLTLDTDSVGRPAEGCPTTEKEM